MCAHSHGGRQTRSSAGRLGGSSGFEQLEAGRRSQGRDRSRSVGNGHSDSDSDPDQECSAGSSSDGEGAEEYLEGVNWGGDVQAWGLAVQAHGSLTQFEGDAAPFPGQTGGVGGTCCHCGEPEGAGPCLVCDDCEGSWHLGCLRRKAPSLESLDQWLCPACESGVQLGRKLLGVVPVHDRLGGKVDAVFKGEGGWRGPGGIKVEGKAEEEDDESDRKPGRRASRIVMKSEVDAFSPPCRERVGEGSPVDRNSLDVVMVDGGSSGGGTELGTGMHGKNRKRKDVVMDARSALALEHLKEFLADKNVCLDGWTALVKDRLKADGRVGSVRHFYFSPQPERRRFHSKLEVARYFDGLETQGDCTPTPRTRGRAGKAEVSPRVQGQELVPYQGELGYADVMRLALDRDSEMNESFDNGIGLLNDDLNFIHVDLSDDAAFHADIGSDEFLDSIWREGLEDDGRQVNVGDTEAEAILELRKYVAERNGVLEDGWRADVTGRHRRGKGTLKYFSPDQKVFRSCAEVARHLGLLDSATPSKVRRLSGGSDSVDKVAIMEQLRSFIAEMNGTLEEGWGVELKKRAGCNTIDKTFVSPDNHKFRSRLEVARFLGLDTSKSRSQSIFDKSKLEQPVSCGKPCLESPLDMVETAVAGDNGCATSPVVHWSTWHDVSSGSLCVSEILDVGHAGSVFRMTRRSCSMLLGRQDDLGRCPIGQGHTVRRSEVEFDLNTDMGEFAVEANSPSEAWKRFAERFVQWLSSHSDVSCGKHPPSVRSMALLLGRDSFCEDEAILCPSNVEVDLDFETRCSRLLERLAQGHFGLGNESVQSPPQLSVPGAEVCKDLGEKDTERPDDFQGADEPAGPPPEEVGSIEVMAEGFQERELSSRSPEEEMCPVEEKPSEPPEKLVAVGESQAIHEAGEAAVDSSLHPRKHSRPAGFQFGAKLPSHLISDVLQIWEFLCRFCDVVGMQLPPFNDFEDALVDQWEATEVTAEQAKPASSQPVGQNDSTDLRNPSQGNSKGEKQSLVGPTKGLLQVASRGMTVLANIHIPLIRLLIFDMKQKILGIQSLDFEELKPKPGNKKSLEDEALAESEREFCLPLNVITWPDVAYRYILALIALKKEDDDLERRNLQYSRISRLIQGDGGVLYGGLDGMAGAEADAQLLGNVERALWKGSSPSGGGPADPTASIKALEDSGRKSMVEAVGQQQKPEEQDRWIEVLDPIAHIPTNTGARIRNRVQEALNLGPPEWARTMLEWSISKEVFKGNAAGPTKHAVLTVLARLRGEEVKPRKCRVRVRTTAPSPALITQRCRLVLREVAAADTSRVFCFLYGNGLFDASDGDGSLKAVSGVVRPLDLRTIDLRLEAGVYLQSPEGFAADVRQIWKNSEAVYKDGSKMLRLSQKLSELFEDLYAKQVLSLLHGGAPQKKRKDMPDEAPNAAQYELVDIGKMLGDSLEKPGAPISVPDVNNNKSTERAEGGELSKAPWDDESCRVCGVDADYDNVLLCDGCEAEYHTYCLSPPLAKVPEGKWFCPQCLALENSFPDRPEVEVGISEGQDSGGYVERASIERSPLHALAERMEGREYWQLSTAEMVLLLKTLCDEALQTTPVRANLEKSLELSLELQQRLQSLVAERSQPRKFWQSKKESESIAGTVVSSGSRVQTRADCLERGTVLKDTGEDSKSRSLAGRNAGGNELGNTQLPVVTQKRKRGRPPKVKTSESHQVTSSANGGAKRRGRPPKNGLPKAVEQDMHPSLEKRRGRPPKRKLETETGEVVPPRKRGRPPKRVAQSPLREEGALDINSSASAVKLEQSAQLDQIPEIKVEAALDKTDSIQDASQGVICNAPEDQSIDVCRDGQSSCVGTTNAEEGQGLLQAELPLNEACLQVELLGDVGCTDKQMVIPSAVPTPGTGTDNMQEDAVHVASHEVAGLGNGQQSDGGWSVDSAEQACTEALTLEIEKLELQIMNTSLRRDYLGQDNSGRNYWVICGPRMRPQVAVEEHMVTDCVGTEDTSKLDAPTPVDHQCTGINLERCERSQWILYETESQFDALITSLRYSKQEKALRANLSQWKKSLVAGLLGSELQEHRKQDRVLPSARVMCFQEEGDKVFTKGFPVLRATRILERRFGPFRAREVFSDSKSSKVKMRKSDTKKANLRRADSMFRCACLEPVWAGRSHCKLCHESYANESDLYAHKCRGHQTRNRKGSKKVASTVPVQAGYQAAESVGRKRKKVSHIPGTTFLNEVQEMHRSKKLTVRKRHSAISASGNAQTELEQSRQQIYGDWDSSGLLVVEEGATAVFGTRESSDGGILEIGCVEDESGIHYVQEQAVGFGYMDVSNKSGSTKRLGKRKGLFASGEQLQSTTGTPRLASREKIIQEIKQLSEDIQPGDVLLASSNKDSSAAATLVEGGATFRWGPHGGEPFMPFGTPDSTRDRVLQIGCIADKGPTFAPALPCSPAFDPSLNLMFQPRMGDVCTGLPPYTNDHELGRVQRPTSDVGTCFEGPEMDKTASYSSFLSNGSADDMLCYREEGDGGLDFFALPVNHHTGWSVDNLGNIATQDGLIPGLLTLEQPMNNPAAMVDTTDGSVQWDRASDSYRPSWHSGPQAGLCEPVSVHPSRCQDFNAGENDTAENVSDVCIPVSSSLVEEAIGKQVMEFEPEIQCSLRADLTGGGQSLSSLLPPKEITGDETPSGLPEIKLADVSDIGPKVETEEGTVNGFQISERQPVHVQDMSSIPMQSSDEKPETVDRSATGILTPTGAKESVLEAEQQDIPSKATGSSIPKTAGVAQEPGKKLSIPESSMQPLDGTRAVLLKWLKMSILDVEAVLTPGMLEAGKGEESRRRAWRALVKSAKSLFEVTQALFVLELMIKTDYLRSSWRHWYSLSAAVKVSNITSVALRLFALDSATSYEVGPVQPKKRGRKRKVRPADTDADD